MALLNPTNQLKFKSSEYLIASIKADLESYDAMGLINNQKLYKHIRYILERLGVATYKEYDAIIDIENYIGKLPENFSILHAGFRLTPSEGPKYFETPLGKFTYYIQETCSKIEQPCSLELPHEIHKQSKIEYQTVVKGEAISNRSWNSPQLLRLSPRTEPRLYSDQCINVGASSADEFAIDVQTSKVYTNFRTDSILLQYYGFPLDELTGLPEIPDQPVIALAIETYLKYKIFEDLYMNSEVQDIERKYLKTELNFKEAFKDALFYVKLPSFQAMVNQAKSARNKFAIYQL